MNETNQPGYVVSNKWTSEELDGRTVWFFRMFDTAHSALFEPGTFRAEQSGIGMIVRVEVVRKKRQETLWLKQSEMDRLRRDENGNLRVDP